MTVESHEMTQTGTSHAVLMLGMHRSGTSAATGALVLRGTWPGEQLMSATPDNPKGYFENLGIFAIHEQLLKALGHAWDDLRPLPEGWLNQDAAISARNQLRTLIAAELMPHPVWVVKDPRLCRLLPLWLPLLDELGIATSAVIVVRDPREVAASLLTRDEWPPELSRELWWQHLEGAIHGSRNLPRHVLTYPRLLADPAAEMDALINALHLNLPSATPAVLRKLQTFISADIRHHRADNDLAPGWEASLCLYRELSVQPVSWEAVHAAIQANPLANHSLSTALGEYSRKYTALRYKFEDIKNSREELHRAKGELNHVRGELNHVRGELNNTRGELNHVRGELNHVRGELNNTRGELNHVRGELNNTQLELQQQQQLVQQILASHSWRVTRPLRWLAKKMRPARGKQ